MGWADFESHCPRLGVDNIRARDEAAAELVEESAEPFASIRRPDSNRLLGRAKEDGAEHVFVCFTVQLNPDQECRSGASHIDDG